ncbi:sterol desaturase family protein [Myxococcus sp. MxC21-1]|uniref:sterol desaturase family protein n=1 Tax=Myxococcus sp. MxC21-1 TaxID=3041439 RepID=UPI0029308B57|nr:sterol desaturase family protein [Myxococcus sp. MxC21-1]WNZ63117.1 sterol desaturase family protein [Myxococcus sp. MxC21-1]
MDLKEQLLYGLPVFLAPILIELVVGLVRRKPAYRLNDLLTNVTMSLLTVLGSVVIAGATFVFYGYVYKHHALFSLAKDSAWTWVVAFFAYDFFYYWAHRMHHTMAWMWGVHVAHHSGEDMNFGLAVRQSALGELTTWPFFVPMALLGIAPEVFLGITGIQLLFQYAIHNTYVPPLGWLEYVLVTPSQHRVHHSRNTPYIDKNYGNILVVWDLLFRTYQPELKDQPPVYGLRSSLRSWNPLTAHFHYFVELFQKSAACARLADKALCFIKGPDWNPPSLRQERFSGPPDGGPSATFEKYDPRLPLPVTAYCVTQFFSLAASILLLAWYLDTLSLVARAVTLGLVLFGTWSLGALMDSRAFAWRQEFARLAGIALLGPALALMEGVPLVSALPILLHPVLSAAWLLRFRAAFHEGADTSTRGSGALAA